MDNLLQKIKELVEAYNDLPNAERVAVVPEKLALEMNVPLQEDEKDISLFYICSYDENRVGLFKELRYSSPKEKVMGYERWSAGSLFLGVESNLIGIKVTHEDFKDDVYWHKVGAIENVDSKRYVCNCNMHEAITFDDMRLMMYEEGVIGPYQLGKATNRDIINVLKYAKGYYEKKTPSIQKTKKQ